MIRESWRPESRLSPQYCSVLFYLVAQLPLQLFENFPAPLKTPTPHLPPSLVTNDPVFYFHRVRKHRLEVSPMPTLLLQHNIVCTWDSQEVQPLWKEIWWCPANVHIPSICKPLQGIYLKWWKHKVTRTQASHSSTAGKKKRSETARMSFSATDYSTFNMVP